MNVFKRRAAHLVLFCLVFVLTLTAAAGPSAPLQAAKEEQAIAVMVNGEALRMDTEPVIQNGRVLVPFRAVAEELDVNVYYEAQNRTVEAWRKDVRVSLPIGQSTVQKNGVWQKTDQPAIIQNGRTLVPLRLFAELFGAQVHWDGKIRQVTVQLALDKPKVYTYGYYFLNPGENYSAAHIDDFSGVGYKWYTMDDAGKLIFANNEGIKRPADYRDRLQLAEDSDTDRYMLLFRYGRNLAEFLADESLCDHFISGVLAECLDAGYTGVELDFEAVPAASKDDLERFVTKLSDALHQNGKKFAAALPAKSTGAEAYSAAFDYGFFAGVLDQVTIMCYDYYPSKPMAQSALSWVDACMDYALDHFDPDQVLLGIGYYGYDYNTDLSIKTTVLPTALPQLAGLRCVDAFQAERGLLSTLDTASGQKTYTYIDDDGENHVVWYEDAETAALKFDLVEKYDLKGLAFWQIAFMDEAIFDLLNETFEIQ